VVVFASLTTISLELHSRLSSCVCDDYDGVGGVIDVSLEYITMSRSDRSEPCLAFVNHSVIKSEMGATNLLTRSAMTFF
jgi:hypothetical protein